MVTIQQGDKKPGEVEPIQFDTVAQARDFCSNVYTPDELLHLWLVVDGNMGRYHDFDYLEAK